jgi:carbonic anhydrase/acetyltransferase-like protein (isoleucine patch superfamily)
VIVSAVWNVGMFCFEFEGKRPNVHPEAFVAPTATLIGDVTVERAASVWYGAVLRADICSMVIGEGANVQDNAVLHAASGTTLIVGQGASIGPLCVVHSSVGGEVALIGNGATLLDNARVGARALVGAGSVVTPGTELPGGMVATGTPARPIKPIEGTSSQTWVDSNPSYYQELARRHRLGATPVEQTL